MVIIVITTILGAHTNVLLPSIVEVLAGFSLISHSNLGILLPVPSEGTVKRIPEKEVVSGIVLFPIF